MGTPSDVLIVIILNKISHTNNILNMLYCRIEGLKKLIRGWMNKSQSKFLEGIWHMPQTCPYMPLFELDQDHVAIGQLLTLGIGLGITAETRIGNNKVTSEPTTTKMEQQDFSLSQRYFIKHLVCVFEKPPNKHDIELEKLEPLIDGSRARSR
jgi:hypothetical protein